MMTDVDIEGRYAYQVLVSEYFKARMERQEQRAEDLRNAIELCGSPAHNWIMRRVEVHR